MAAVAKGDRVRWDRMEWIVSFVWNTNSEGWRADLRRHLSDAAYEKRSVPVNECEKLEGGE
jgi:hypothetical protein